MLTTYENLYATEKAEGGESEQVTTPLHDVWWDGIILDEGHRLGNPGTAQSWACGELWGRARWVLTGTPLSNSPVELRGMARFLKWKEVMGPKFDKKLDMLRHGSTREAGFRALQKMVQVRSPGGARRCLIRSAGVQLLREVVN